MNLANDAFECYSINRFTPSKSDAELEDMAIELKENETFYAGITFLDETSDDLVGQQQRPKDTELREHTKYKIRLAMDETPRSNELKPKYVFSLSTD